MCRASSKRVKPAPRQSECKISVTWLRLVTYSSGYEADHWCDKGHVLHVVAGTIIIEYRDQARVVLDAGKSWHAPDGASPAHRVVCETGATVFIVD